MVQKYWLGIYHADYRKLKNQSRFIQEIIDGDLVVSKKKKDVLVRELRDRKYEAFPRKDPKKTTEDEMDESADEDDEVKEGSAGDFDYLLSVSQHIWNRTQYGIANIISDAHLVPDP
jgi:DNA topoisomerase-2